MLKNCPACGHKVSKEYCLICPKCNHNFNPPTPKDKTRRHETAINETHKDLHEKTEEYLLTEIHEESQDQTRLPSETISRTMARFAGLLVLLSRKSSEAANKNLKMQKSINCLTWTLLALTIILCFFGFVQIITPIIKLFFKSQ